MHKAELEAPGSLLRILFGYPIVSKKSDGIIVNAETLAGGRYKFISDYLIISHCLIDTGSYPEGSPRLLRHVSAMHKAELQAPDRILFGYPIVSKKRDGIMVNAETLAGG